MCYDDPMISLRKVLQMIFAVSVITYSLAALYKVIRTSAPDFSVYYNAAQHLIHAQSLYTNISFTLFAYPPISSFFFIPFTFFSYQIAQGIFLLISYISVFFVVFFAFKLLNKNPTKLAYATGVALFLLSFPTKFTLGMGQSNVVALACFLACVVLQRQNKFILSGILLAVAIIFKPVFVLLVGYFLLNRLWKIIVTCIASGLLIFSIQIMLFPNTVASWIEYLTHILPHLMTTAGREVYYNQGLLGTISRLSQNTTVRSVISDVGIVFFLGVVVWVIRKSANNNNFHLSLFLCVLPLIDTLSWQHHFVILLFPMMYTFYTLHTTRERFFLLLSYASISYNIKTPNQFLYFPGNLILSHVFWGALLLFGLLLYTLHGKGSKRSITKRK